MLFLLKTLFFIDGLLLAALLLFRWALVPRARAVVPGKFVALALFTPVVALFCGNLVIFWAYLAAVVAFTSRSRIEVAGVYLFLLPQMPNLDAPLGGHGMYLGAGSAAIAMGLGALIGFAITGAGPGRREAWTLTRYDLGMWAIVLIFIFIDNRDQIGNGLVRALTEQVLGIAGPFLLISRGVRRAADAERLLLRLCLGGTIVALTACYTARVHWALFETYLQAMHVPTAGLSANFSMRAGLLRTGGSMVNFGAGGLFLAAVITLLPLLRRHFRPAGFWTLTVLLIAGLFASESRGAWVAAIVGLTFVAACRGQWTRAALLAGGAVAAEAAVLTFARTGTLAQIAGNAGPASGNVTYRQMLASQGFDQVLAHPLLGQSQLALITNLIDLRQGEGIVDFVNGHLFIAMAAGVPACLLWLVIVLMPVVEGWRRRRGEHALLAIAPAAIIVPVAVALTFTSFIDRNLTWVIVALGMAAPCLTLGRRPAIARPRPVTVAAVAA